MNFLRPGEQLKDLRSSLGITTRDVTERSQRIAEAEHNEEFSISNAWLTQVENTHATPSIYKLYSLSTIYHVKFTDLLLLFGVDLQKIGRHQLSMPLEQTHLTNIETNDPDRSVSFPVRFDRGFNLEKTNLLSRMVEIWGEIPISLIQHLDIRRNHYGYIGLHDYTLSPLLRPGSFVQIDQRLRKVQSSKWRTEFDRPIYFIELREGYACSWCELQGSQLILVPHPLSPCSIRQFLYATDAEIVGQVTGIAMRIVDATERPADETPQLPKRA
ncbi:MAG TPA: helix-turn-helix transcriptional regulator [Candidatus Dormibacteraeota bacterium]|nr:helix-turn-helix transcriptional regulator [Candidatus Dormibacteraeota bacterium]